MTATHGRMKCKLYLSAFSGEKVFQVETMDEQSFEGVAPNHYVESDVQPTKDGVDGYVKVRVLSNKEGSVRVSIPDGQILSVSADKV